MAESAPPTFDEWTRQVQAGAESLRDVLGANEALSHIVGFIRASVRRKTLPEVIQGWLSLERAFRIANDLQRLLDKVMQPQLAVDRKKFATRCRHQAELHRARANAGQWWQATSLTGDEYYALDNETAKLFSQVAKILDAAPVAPASDPRDAVARQWLKLFVRADFPRDYDWPSTDLGTFTDDQIYEAHSRDPRGLAGIGTTPECSRFALVCQFFDNASQSPDTEWATRFIAASINNVESGVHFLNLVFRAIAASPIPRTRWFFRLVEGLRNAINTKFKITILPAIDPQSGKPSITGVEIAIERQKGDQSIARLPTFVVSPAKPIVTAYVDQVTYERFHEWRQLLKSLRLIIPEELLSQLESGYQEAKARAFDGQPPAALKGVQLQFAKTESGKQWFHRFAGAAKREGGSALNAFQLYCKSIGLQCFPDIDPSTLSARWPVNVPYPKACRRILGIETGIAAVDRYAAEPADAALTIIEPVHAGLRAVFSAVMPLQHSCPAMYDAVERANQQVTNRNGLLEASELVGLANQLITLSLSDEDKNSVFNAIKKSLLALDPPCYLIPREWEFGRPVRHRRTDGVISKFQFHPLVQINDLIRVERFAVNSQNTSPARILVSAGKEYRGYSEICKALSESTVEYAGVLSAAIVKWPEERCRQDGGQMEEPFAEFFKSLWPSNPLEGLRPRDEKLWMEVVNWFKEHVLPCAAFEVDDPREGEYVAVLKSREHLTERDVEQRSSETLPRNPIIASVVRPFMRFKNDLRRVKVGAIVNVISG